MNAKTTMLALLASVTLVGCGCAPSSQPASLSSAESSHATGLSSAESSHATGFSSAESSHATGLSTSESSQATGLSTSEASTEESSYATGLSSSESESLEPLTYTAEQVANETNANLEAAGYSARLEYDSSSRQWWTRVAFSAGEDTSEEKLRSYADELAAYLPDYMLDNELEAVYGDPADPDYENIINTGIFYYVYLYQSPDKNVLTWVMSYLSGGIYFVDLYIF